jgi:hypothetical protein
MEKHTLSIVVLFLGGISGMEAVNFITPVPHKSNNEKVLDSNTCQISVRTGVRTNELCRGGSTGIAMATATGGTAPYTYSWNPGGATNNVVSGLSAGVYTVNVLDSNGCTGSALATITQPAILSVSYYIAPSANCNGDTIANVTALPHGGTSPYTYSWSRTGGTNAEATGLSLGIYTVSVSDSCGISASRIVIIIRPDTLRARTVVINNVSCYGGANGLAKAAASGGASPYTYSWSPNANTTYAAGSLSAGTYTISITDRNGCNSTSSVTITQPSTILKDSVSGIVNASCHGGTGSATIGAMGGVPPLTYIWNPSISSTYVGTGLAARRYQVIVKDSTGCSSICTFSVTQPAGLTILPYTSPDHRHCVGSAWVRVSGGILPYTYLWSGGQTTDTITNQCNGTYCCMVTEANGCTDSICLTIPIATGINELTDWNGQLTIYPNPNNGTFTILLPELTSNPSIEIYNMLGQKIFSQLTGNATKMIVNIGSASTGMYLYRLLKEDGSLLDEGKIIIEK